MDDEKPIIEMNSRSSSAWATTSPPWESSVKALELFTAAPDAFDLVITDQAMPDLTGIELAERIRSVRNNIPIIMITGFSETIDAERAKKMGIRQFLMKPLIRRELAEAIRNVLDGPELGREARHMYQSIRYFCKLRSFFMIMARPASPAFIMERREVLSRAIFAAMASPYCGLWYHPPFARNCMSWLISS